jgi:hypothetical protein
MVSRFRQNGFIRRLFDPFLTVFRSYLGRSAASGYRFRIISPGSSAPDTKHRNVTSGSHRLRVEVECTGAWKIVVERAERQRWRRDRQRGSSRRLARSGRKVAAIPRTQKI